jgi:hypothetical protein
VSDRVDLEVQLPRATCGPRLARWVMRSWFSGATTGGLVADAELLVSELVSHALADGEGSIILRAGRDEDRLLVEVIDQRSTFRRQLWRNDIEATGRLGLDIVKDISSRWGANETMTHVWFELEPLRV